jgi:hypothetical protein
LFNHEGHEGQGGKRLVVLGHERREAFLTTEDTEDTEGFFKWAVRRSASSRETAIKSGFRVSGFEFRVTSFTAEGAEGAEGSEKSVSGFEFPVSGSKAGTSGANRVLKNG